MFTNQSSGPVHGWEEEPLLRRVRVMVRVMVRVRGGIGLLVDV